MMKIYMIYILGFTQILSAIEDNPFPVKKNFKSIDKVEYNLFATLQDELEEADIVLNIPTVKFKDLQIDSPIAIPKKLPLNIEETPFFTTIDNFLRKQQEENSSFFNTFNIETYINKNIKINQMMDVVEKRKTKNEKKEGTSQRYV